MADGDLAGRVRRESLHFNPPEAGAVAVAAAGVRNRENFKTAIYFHCGGLDLYPH